MRRIPKHEYEGIRISAEKHGESTLIFPTLKSQKAANTVGHEEEGKEEESKTGFFTPNEKIDFSNVKIEPLFEEQVDFDTFSKSDFRAVKVKDCVAVPKSKKLLQFTLDDGTGTDRTILSGIHAYYEPEELIGKTLIAIVNLPPRKMMGIAPSDGGQPHPGRCEVVLRIGAGLTTN